MSARAIAVYLNKRLGKRTKISVREQLYLMSKMRSSSNLRPVSKQYHQPHAVLMGHLKAVSVPSKFSAPRRTERSRRRLLCLLFTSHLVQHSLDPRTNLGPSKTLVLDPYITVLSALELRLFPLIVGL